ncbi:MAG: TonB-dependent receptor, partial [Bacteroidota bacterium]
MKFSNCHFLLISFILLFSFSAFSQQGFVKGEVVEVGTEQPIPGVQVFYTSNKGVSTDLDGLFSLELASGSYEFIIRHISYKIDTLPIEIAPGESKLVKIALMPAVNQLELVSITANKYEKDVMTEPVSIEVIKPVLLEQVNITRIDQVLEKIPGITVADGQVSIRSGSSYAFGSGTRVQMILDGLPLISADRNDIRWNFFPVEMTGQLEVLKGASSTLYGSSALNGVIHLRTMDAGEEPITEVTTYYQVFDKPENKAQAWWESAPFEYGVSFKHARQVGLFDIIASGNYISTNSYIRGGDSMQQRYFLKIKKRKKNYYGLELSLLAGVMDSQEADFLFWENDNEGAFVPFGGDNPNNDFGIIDFDRRQFTLQPQIIYTDKKRNKHLLNTRYYQFETLNFVENTFFSQYTADYQYHTSLGNRIKLIGGATAQYYDVTDPNGISNRTGNNVSAYLQTEYIWQKFSGSLGVRYEYFDAEGLSEQQIPVVRLAGNYRLNFRTSLRASFGQGYRFPSFVEAFLDQSDAAIPIFPNPDLQPEYGWNAELGIKKQLGNGDFITYLDGALFVSEYFDMIEFRPGIFIPDSLEVPADERLDYIGVRSENLDRTRIGGFEFSATGEGKLQGIPFRLLMGYTYTYPVFLENNSDLISFTGYAEKFFKSIFSNDDDIIEPMLRYRQRHLIKADLSIEPGNFSFGTDIRYYSFIERVDAFLGIAIPGVDSYRNRNDAGEFILNLRLGYDFGKLGSLRTIIANVLNREYSLRYARMDPPRNLTF